MTETPGGSPGSPSFPEFFRQPRAALAIALGTYLLSVFLVVIAPALRQHVPDAQSGERALFDLILLSFPLVAGACVAFISTAPRRFVRALLTRWPVTDIVIGIGVGLLLRAVMELIAPTTGSLTGPFDPDPAVDVGTYIVITVITIAVVSPVVEEVYFRGVLLNALRDVGWGWGRLGRRSAAGLALLLSTVAFVALHIIPAGDQVPVALIVSSMAVGLACGVFTIATRRIAGAVCAHVVFNTLGVVLLLV